MILKKIELLNFRNYEKLQLNLNSHLNVFIGKNGMGKTNILEAIYFLAITKSHRVTNDKKMIMMSKKNVKVKGTVKYRDKIDNKLEIILTEDVKKVFLDNKEVRKMSEYISNLNVIIFSPETIELLKGSPNIRRKFLNIEIAQINQKYLVEVNTYNNLLKTRNEYLKVIKLSKKIDETYLDILNDKLASSAANIFITRNNFIDKINSRIDKIYSNIAVNGVLRLKYLTSFQNYEYEYIKEYMIKKYKLNLKSEIDQGMTIFGPHRDDFLFVLDDKDLKLFGSQGQQRMALLSLKMAEVEIFKEVSGEYPILLLDDIFSELDKYKQKNIFTYIDTDIQIIMTTTDISKRKLHNANIYTIQNGLIKNEEVKYNE